jgi:hypothetical protein
MKPNKSRIIDGILSKLNLYDTTRRNILYSNLHHMDRESLLILKESLKE